MAGRSPAMNFYRKDMVDVRKMLIRVRNLYLKWISLINGQSIFTEMKTFRLKNVMTPLWPKIVIASSPVSRLLYSFKYFFHILRSKKQLLKLKLCVVDFTIPLQNFVWSLPSFFFRVTRALVYTTAISKEIHPKLRSLFLCVWFSFWVTRYKLASHIQSNQSENSANCLSWENLKFEIKMTIVKFLPGHRTSDNGRFFGNSIGEID